MMAFKDLAFKPPIYAIRVKSCGNDWVTDCDATFLKTMKTGTGLSYNRQLLTNTLTGQRSASDEARNKKVEQLVLSPRVA